MMFLGNEAGPDGALLAHFDEEYRPHIAQIAFTYSPALE